MGSSHIIANIIGKALQIHLSWIRISTITIRRLDGVDREECLRRRRDIGLQINGNTETEGRMVKEEW